MYPVRSCFSPDICPGVGLHVRLVTPSLVFEGTSILFPWWLCQFTSPPVIHGAGVGQRSLFLTSFPHLLFVTFFFWITTVLTGEQWSSFWFLTCSPLMIRDVEHLFMCCLAICMSSLRNSLFKSFTHCFF